MKIDKQKFILDACCGGRYMWFDKNHSNALYIDIREAPKGHIDDENHEVNPDMIMDFRDLKFDDETFRLVVWDPPHMKTLSETSKMRKIFGCLNAETWRYDLTKGFEECWRVLKPHGVLIFKWNETEIKLKEVLKCFKEQPLFGHKKTEKTYWMTFMKIPKGVLK